jgi:hypothetical protein
MNTTYLDYYKQVLEKVSFDPQLFHKEYLKASKSLGFSEQEELDNWLQAKGIGYHILPLRKPEMTDLSANNFQYYRLWSSI